jgi:integrase
MLERAVPFFGAASSPRPSRPTRGATSPSSRQTGWLRRASARKLHRCVRCPPPRFEEGAVRSNPSACVRVNGRRDEHEEEQAKALSREELGALLAELPEEWRFFFEFLAHTGLRISEAVGLRWSDVAFGARPVLRVRHKLARGEQEPSRLKGRYSRRDIPLSAGLARRLWQRRKEVVHRGDSDSVFVSRNRGALGRRTSAIASSSRPAAGGRRVGGLPRIPSYLRLPAVRRRAQRQAVTEVARPRRPRLHDADLHPLDRRSAGQRRLP